MNYYASVQSCWTAPPINTPKASLVNATAQLGVASITSLASVIRYEKEAQGFPSSSNSQSCEASTTRCYFMGNPLCGTYSMAFQSAFANINHRNARITSEHLPAEYGRSTGRHRKPEITNLAGPSQNPTTSKHFTSTYNANPLDILHHPIMENTSNVSSSRKTSHSLTAKFATFALSVSEKGLRGLATTLHRSDEPEQQQITDQSKEQKVETSADDQPSQLLDKPSSANSAEQSILEAAGCFIRDLLANFVAKTSTLWSNAVAFALILLHKAHNPEAKAADVPPNHTYHGDTPCNTAEPSTMATDTLKETDERKTIFDAEDAILHQTPPTRDPAPEDHATNQSKSQDEAANTAGLDNSSLKFEAKPSTQESPDTAKPNPSPCTTIDTKNAPVSKSTGQPVNNRNTPSSSAVSTMKSATTPATITKDDYPPAFKFTGQPGNEKPTPSTPGEATGKSVVTTAFTFQRTHTAIETTDAEKSKSSSNTTVDMDFALHVEVTGQPVPFKGCQDPLHPHSVNSATSLNITTHSNTPPLFKVTGYPAHKSESADPSDSATGKPVATPAFTFQPEFTLIEDAQKQSGSVIQPLEQTVETDTIPIPRCRPCPCGSGHKYKKCCGKGTGPATTPGPTPMPIQSTSSPIIAQEEEQVSTSASSSPSPTASASSPVSSITSFGGVGNVGDGNGDAASECDGVSG